MKQKSDYFLLPTGKICNFLKFLPKFLVENYRARSFIFYQKKSIPPLKLNGHSLSAKT
jgi:hypothetical protein